MLPRNPTRRVTPNLTRHLAGPAVLALLAATLVACGDDDTATPPTESTTVTDVELEPVEDGEDGGEVDPTDGTGPDGSGPDDPMRTTKPEVDVPAEAPTELVVTDLVTGQGHEAQTGDSVVLDYVGVRTADGTEFDNSYDRGIPFSVRLGEGRVIAGWDEGLVGVQTGTQRQIDIPTELAYGDNPPGGSAIEPGDALTFVVDVRAVIASVTEDDAPADLPIEPSVGATELGIIDVVVGDGAELVEEQTAIAHLVLHRGDDLEVLDNTWVLDDPAQVVMSEGGPVEGLVDGLLGMQVGGIRIITIPPDLAFGDEGIPEIGLDGDVDIIVVAELVGAY